MTWGARTGRVVVLTALAVGWAVQAHAWAVHGGLPEAAPLPPVLWSAALTGLVGWWLVPLWSRTRSPLLRAWLIGGGLATGQVVTHLALAIAPLVGSPRAGAPTAMDALHGHAGHMGGGGGLDLGALTAALGHGGPAMLLAHAVATVASSLVWAMLGTLAGFAADWWARVRPVAPVLARSRRPRLPGVTVTWCDLSPAFSWTGRAPPAPAR